MIGRRIGAAVAAVALIVGALLARNALDDDAAAEDDGARPPPTGDLACATELGDVCRAIAASFPDLELTIEDAGTTLERFAALDEAGDASLWLTIDPFPRMVDELRRLRGSGPLPAQATPVGTTRLAIALPDPGREDILVEACAGAPLWRCIGEHAGDEWAELGGDARWATIDPSLGDPETSAVALASLANAVAGYLDDPDVSLSRWESDPGFAPWLRGLARAVPANQLSGRSPLATMVIRESAVDISATTDAEVDALGAPGEALAVQYPEPSMSAVAVLSVPSGQSAPGGLVDDLTATLAAAGWEPAPATAASLPSAGVMLALRTLWADTT